VTTYQTAGNILVAISRETTIGTAATATGSTQLRITDSQGLELKRGVVQSSERREDGLKTMGRLGNKWVEGSFNAELSAGGANDILIEAIQRSTWTTSVATTFVSMTTVAVGTNTLTAAAGSWLTQGIKVGDIVTLTGTSQSANHNLRTPVTAVSTLVVTVATSTYTIVGAASTGTVTRLKKVVSPTTPTRLAHTIEQVDEDADLSELFTGCRLTGMKISARPNAYVTVTYTFMGINRTTYTGGSSPYFTSPTLTTNLGLIADDGVIRYNGSAVTNFTGFDLDFSINAAVASVVGTTTSPDVFDNDLTVTGSISALRSDFSNLTLFDAETEFEFQATLLELEAAPKSCLSFFLPRVKIQALSAPVGGGDNAKVETLQLMIGPKDTATGYDTTVANISSSE
jgi:hypothetical protein